MNKHKLLPCALIGLLFVWLVTAANIVCAKKGAPVEFLFKDVYFFSSRRRHTRGLSAWSSDVCSSDLLPMDCCKPVLNWLRWPGWMATELAPKTFWANPPTPVALERSRFSLNGVSKVLA